MLVFNAFLTVHTTFCFFYVYFFYDRVFVFYVLFAMCVNDPLWTDFQINGWMDGWIIYSYSAVNV